MEKFLTILSAVGDVTRGFALKFVENDAALTHIRVLLNLLVPALLNSIKSVM